MIGEKLKEARLKNGITIEELQQKTKIQRRYLEALEEDDYGAMPGTFYVRTFVRQYAEAVGLNSASLVAQFDNRNREVPEEPEITGSRAAVHQEETIGMQIKQKIP